MLIHVSLSIGGFALLYALFAHLRRNRRVSGGIVLAAAMLTLEAIVHPPIEQVIAQQLDESDEHVLEEGESSSLENQIRRQAKRIRRGQCVANLNCDCPHMDWSMHLHRKSGRTDARLPATSAFATDALSSRMERLCLVLEFCC